MINSHMDWKTFVKECVTTYRPIGFFQDDFFSDEQAFFEKLIYEIDSIGLELFTDYEFLNSDLDMAYSVLISLDQKNVANINIKKAGAEEGKGYYKKSVEQLVNCFSKNCKIQESYSEEIVSLGVTAQLASPWVGGESSLKTKVVQQSFAPLKSWTDYIFYEQLLKNLLGENLHKVKTRIGTSEECAMFIFPSTEEADHVISQFEKKYLSEDYGVSEYMVPNRIPDIPQPTIENISQICESVGLSVFKDDDDIIDAEFLRGLSEGYRPPAPSLSFWEKWEDWIVGFIWGVCISFVAYLAYDTYTSEPLCYSFEEYISDTNQCAVPCLEGESQAQCDARAEKLRLQEQ